MKNEIAFNQVLPFIPRLYSTENVELADKIVYAHLTFGAFDWYICEYDPKTDKVFGYHAQSGEWGYAKLSEFRKLKIKGLEISFDIDWTIRLVKEIDDIPLTTKMEWTIVYS